MQDDLTCIKQIQYTHDCSVDMANHMLSQQNVHGVLIVCIWAVDNMVNYRITVSGGHV